MAQINITASQLRAATQRIQNKYVIVELLNNNFQVVDSLHGICTDGTIALDADSDMRRSGSIQLVVQDASFEVQVGGRIFLDKYVRIKIGTYSIAEDEIIYTNCGIFIIDAPNYNYEPSTSSLTLTLLDLMARLSGVRNGYLQGVPIKIMAGESIREAIIDTLALGGFTRYIVDEAPGDGTLPVDLDFPQGSTIYTVLSALRDVYPNYEIYFDVDGVFHYNPIPTGEDEPVQLNDNFWEKIVVGENKDTNFQAVKNSIEVYGRIHDPAHYSTSTAIANDIITLTIADVVIYEDGVIYGFSLPSNTTIAYPTLRINSLSVYDLEDEDGTVESIVTGDTEEYYCVRWDETNQVWYYLGHLQAYALAEDTNQDSPFYVEGTVGRIRMPLYGGEYDNILTDNLAKQRAQYELWARTQLQTTVNLNCISVEWLEVNTLVEYTLQNYQEPYKWIIKGITFNLNPTALMSVRMSRFYPNYFYI